MKADSRERLAGLLLDELFHQLKERANIRRMVADFTVLPIDDAVEQLIGDIEQAIARRRTILLNAGRLASTQSEMESPAPSAPPSITGKPLSSDNPPLTSPPSADTAQDEKTRTDDVGDTVGNRFGGGTRLTTNPGMWEDLERTLEDRLARIEPDAMLSEVEEEVDDAEDVVDEDEFDEEFEDDEITPEESGFGINEKLTPCDFTDNDFVYVHAFGRALAGGLFETPMSLETKGIDGRNPIFFIDYEGLRCYLSKFIPGKMNISKTGVLLAGSKENLHLRGLHESILNDIRHYGLVLPAEFGSVARGRGSFCHLVDTNLDELNEAIELEEATIWWGVSVWALDARVAQVVGTQATQERKGRTVERASYSRMPSTKRFDLKVLERILTRERKIAEAVHDQLAKAADRGDVDSMVSLASGSSTDWKLLLKASYEVERSRLPDFIRKVMEVQKHYQKYDLMIAFSGDAGSIHLSSR